LDQGHAASLSSNNTLGSGTAASMSQFCRGQCFRAYLRFEIGSFSIQKERAFLFPSCFSAQYVRK
jgi:hypothetical protein